MWSALFLVSVAVSTSGNADAACFSEAAARYGIPRELLVAISRVESSGNPLAINRNKDNSYDIGHMQINSRWLGALSRFGIAEQHLWDPCTSTMVGAWILAGNINRLGYSWDAVGAYNARSPEKRVKYAHKVASAMKREHSH